MDYEGVRRVPGLWRRRRGLHTLHLLLWSLEEVGELRGGAPEERASALRQAVRTPN